MNTYALPQIDSLSCTIVEGNGRETDATFPIHTTKRGRKWIAASPVKMDQHGTLYIYALFLDEKSLEADSAAQPGSHHYKDKLRRGDAVPYFDLAEI